MVKLLYYYKNEADVFLFWLKSGAPYESTKCNVIG